MSKRALLLALLLAACGQHARAIDLQGAVAQAGEVDPALQAGAHALNASKEGRAQAIAAMLPAVNMVGTPSRLRGDVAFFGQAPTSRTFSSTSWSAKLSQPLLHAQHWIGYARAGTTITQVELKQRIARRDATLKTVQTYLDLLMACDDTLVAQDQYALAKEKVSVAEAGLQLGSTTLAEVAEARLALARGGMDSRRAGAAQEEKRGLLEALLQAPVEQIIKLDLDGDIAPFAALARVLQEQTPAPDEAALEVRVKQLGVALARHDLRMQWAANLPTVDLTVTKGRYREGGNIDLPLSASTASSSTVVGLQINVPIVSGGDAMSRIRQGSQQALQAEAELRAASNDAQRTLRSNTTALRNEVALLGDIRSTQELAAAVARDERAAFDLGRRIQVDVLAAEYRVRALRRDFNRSSYNGAMRALTLRSQLDLPDFELIAELTRWIGQNGRGYRCDGAD